jgi:hypothetical protein
MGVTMTRPGLALLSKTNAYTGIVPQPQERDLHVQYCRVDSQDSVQLTDLVIVKD